MSVTCPVCGDSALSIGDWHESKADTSDKFRIIAHAKNGMMVTEDCIQTK